MVLLTWLLPLVIGIANADADAKAERNFVANGDLSKGSGAVPDQWQSEAWQKGDEFSTYTWHPAGAAPAMLEVSSSKPNDARWSQKVHLGPGWYHFTAEMRAEDVPSTSVGANLSIVEDGMISEQLHGTTDWQTVGFYLKAGGSGADVELGCRIGGFANLNTGKVFCRDLKAVEIAGEPPDAGLKYDLDVIRGVSSAEESDSTNPSAPSGPTNNTASVTALFVAALAVLAGLMLSRNGNGERGVTLTDLLERVRHVLRSGGPLSAPVSAIDKARRETEIALFMVCVLTFAYFYQASDHSTASRIDLIRALLERHSLWIDGFAGFNTADIVELHSHIYSNKAPGGAITGILPWIFVTTLLRIFTSPPSGFYWAFATYLVTVVTVSVVVAMMVVLVYRFALMLGASSGRAVALGLTLAFGTIMFPYATEFTSEPISALCVFAAFYLLALPQDENAPWWQSLFAGLLAGWGVLCDYPTFLIAAAVGAYAIWRLETWGKIVTFVAGATVVADLLMALQQGGLGQRLVPELRGLRVAGRQPLRGAGQGLRRRDLSPALDPVGHPDRPSARHLVLQSGAVAGHSGAVFFLAPQVAAAGVSDRGVRGPGYDLFNASYGDSIVYWGGGTAVGPRHFVPVLPFAVLAMAFLPERINPLFAVLALSSRPS